MIHLKGITKTKSSLIVVTLLLLTACGEKTVEEAKSLAYYGEHLAEADVVHAKCVAMEKHELSTMPPSKRLAWIETATGINCKNASQARSDETYKAYQKKMRDAANKY
ncbi:hypothetical protein [Glaciimonas soli]|uniref:Lipoprotein n=1 Tax=Glaciimonas soli TaxID=2590999 RepID=A0A843YRE2_9BURK|nr:hypothetical protein [Glaciimonas soli]MQR02115.1 hypothetical protein [Glaciimonas soli]